MNHPSDNLHDALSSLREIGALINRIGSDEASDIHQTLGLIVESATKVVSGSIAVIYTYDSEQMTFDEASRVSAGEVHVPVDDINPRPDGMGHTAVAWRRRIVSYQDEGPDMHPRLVAQGVRASSCFPLIVAEQVVGVLYVYIRRAERFDETELLMLDNFVNLAAMAIYHTRRVESVRADLSRREDEIARLRRAGLLISSRTSLNSTLDAILQMAMEITGAKYGIFRLLERASGTLQTAAFAGDNLKRPMVDSLPIDSDSIMGWVALHHEPLLIPDLREPPWRGIYKPLDRELAMRSELAVPLVGSGARLEGVLNLESPMTHAFTERDSLLLQALATQAVIAIQEARLLDALQTITGWLLTKPVREILKSLVHLADDLLDAASSAVWVREDDAIVLRESSSPALKAGMRLPVVSSLPGRVILSPTPLFEDRLLSQPETPHIAAARHSGWQRVLIVPMLANASQEPIGAISVYSQEGMRGPGETDRDKKVVNILAHYAALAVQNAARQDELRAVQEQRTIAETFAALGDIAANLLHQLNNKIGTIPVRVEGVRMKSAALVEADDYLATNLNEIEASARDAMNVVRENLTLLRPIRTTPVWVGQCITEALASARLGDHITVHLENLDLLPQVIASRPSLTLVFTNLIENASSAMQGHGTITIAGQPAGAWVEVAVADTGPGIAPHLHTHIFELNYSSGAVNHAGKLGFGLWWVKTLMTRLGGKIAVESDGHNGTTFRLQLPKHDQEVT